MGFSLYSATVQVVIVGLLAFCGPGLFNALQGLGGAGNENTDYANAANAALYATFAVFGYLGGPAFNLFGNKILMSVGGFTYAIYAGTQYAAGNVANLGWISPVGGAILGFGAGWFWTAQGAMMLAYSTPEVRGQYIAIFWVIFNLGGMIGGFIAFGINYNTVGGTANAATYFVFIGLMCLGAVASIFVLVHPSKVQRRDGELVVFEENTDFLDEMKGILKVTIDSNMLLLMPLFVASNFYYTYQFNGINSLLFNVRSRGFNSAMYWGMQMVGSVAISYFLDKKGWGQRKRGITGFVIVFVSFNLISALGAYLAVSWEGGYDKGNTPEPRIDFTDSARAWYPTTIFLFYAFCDALVQTYAYWIMAALARGNTSLCARYTGLYKGVQSAGAAVAWGIDLSDSVTYKIQFWLNWGLFVVSMVLAGFCVFKLSDEDDLSIVNDKSVVAVTDGQVPSVFSSSITSSGSSSSSSSSNKNA
eukprot:Lankesteria_metandrocarpae@DN5084_c1_g1_i2.p1